MEHRLLKHLSLHDLGIPTTFPLRTSPGADRDFDLALKYQNGRHEEGRDLALAKSFYETAVSKNHSGAMVNLGLMYQRGEGVDQDYVQAFKLFKKSAIRRDSYGYLNVALAYLRGHGVEKDPELGFRYLERARRASNPLCLVHFGITYEFGYVGERDLSKALEYYELAGEKGNGDAWLNAGLMYCNGRGTEQNFAKAFECYNKALNAGCDDALVSLGYLYQLGYGCDIDFVKARELFEQAVEKKCASAHDALGVMYYFGRGVPYNIDKAVHHFQTAVDQGDLNAVSNLGALYGYGEGVPLNPEKAAEYYRKVGPWVSRARTNLAITYLFGDHCEQDVAKAIELLNEGIQLGSYGGYFYLALSKLFGYDGKPDVNAFRELLLKGVDEDFSLMPEGAVYLCEGVGDTSKAIELLERATSISVNVGATALLTWIRLITATDDRRNQVAADCLAAWEKTVSTSPYERHLGHVGRATAFACGLGVDADLAKAVQYLTRGADNESHMCQVVLALLLKLGIVAPPVAEGKEASDEQHSGKPVKSSEEAQQSSQSQDGQSEPESQQHQNGQTSSTNVESDGEGTATTDARVSRLLERAARRIRREHSFFELSFLFRRVLPFYSHHITVSKAMLTLVDRSTRGDLEAFDAACKAISNGTCCEPSSTFSD